MPKDLCSEEEEEYQSREDDAIWGEDDPMHHWTHGRWKSVLERMEENQVLGKFWQEKCRNEATRNWDLFYKRHTTNFFKDRHYLEDDYPFLRKAKTEPLTLVEFGCGVGNAFFPCVERLPFLRVHAFDLSRRAIRLIYGDDRMDSARINAFFYDPTSFYDWPSTVSEDPLIIAKNGADAALMLFVLSAVEPAFHSQCFDRARSILRPGGRILFRDYGRFDEAELRFRSKQRLGKHFYTRHDGTCAYFFGVEELTKHAHEHGFRVLDCHFICRIYQNRKQQTKMRRVWVHAEFEKRGEKFISSDCSENEGKTWLSPHPEALKCLARASDFHIA
eukprot:gb/GECG01001288.1/.p1 GENE.gb/GECG01001288.1/~~gb/GECG01001288.1/.p1  ORF type:complete len:332 (+),score=31.89 gb/GECG01001288.1/:1-996(+)